MPAKVRFHKRYPHHKPKLVEVLVTITAVVVAAVIFLLQDSDGNDRSGQAAVDASQSQANSITINGQPSGGVADGENYGPTANGPYLSNDPRAQIVKLTGSWSDQGFANAIADHDTTIIGLYLKSGLRATTLVGATSSPPVGDTSAILFGFQGAWSKDLVAFVKIFQADGFRVDDELEDSSLLQKLTDNAFPGEFLTQLTPQGYVGVDAYGGGVFVGTLLFWIVQLALSNDVTEQDSQLIDYLIGQGADCKVPLSFMQYNSGGWLYGSSYNELLPIMQSCAK
jgi:hypothetical protein